MISVKIVNETACLMLMQNDEMLDYLFINKYFFDPLSPDEHKMIANVYKETYNATQCHITAKEKNRTDNWSFTVNDGVNSYDYT